MTFLPLIPKGNVIENLHTPARLPARQIILAGVIQAGFRVGANADF
jgi:hypothetical protein